MKKISLIFLMILAAGILLSNSVLAYIDPSTGGILFNTIWPLIVAFFAVVGAFIAKWFWNPLKRIYSKIFTRN